MTATTTIKVCTGSSAETETTSTNLNFLNEDSVDSGTDYQTKKILIPSSGTNYSYERWFRVEFTDSFNAIENVKFYKSAGSLGTGLGINAGTTSTGAAPTDTSSSVASSSIPTSAGSAIDITPTAGIDTAGDKTDYGVMQLTVGDTANPGDIAQQTITIQYDES